MKVFFYKKNTFIFSLSLYLHYKKELGAEAKNA